MVEMIFIMNVAARKIHRHLVKGESVYVHCYAGRSRSPTVVVYYLMLYHDFSFPDALKWVERYRPCVNINEGFIQILTVADVIIEKLRELDRSRSSEKTV
jgi:protein-tyrosine phosphatase